MSATATGQPAGHGFDSLVPHHVGNDTHAAHVSHRRGIKPSSHVLSVMKLQMEVNPEVEEESERDLMGCDVAEEWVTSCVVV
jgi:hypothetical protein